MTLDWFFWAGVVVSVLLVVVTSGRPSEELAALCIFIGWGFFGLFWMCWLWIDFMTKLTMNLMWR